MDHQQPRPELESGLEPVDFSNQFAQTLNPNQQPASQMTATAGYAHLSTPSPDPSTSYTYMPMPTSSNSGTPMHTANSNNNNVDGSGDGSGNGSDVNDNGGLKITQEKRIWGLSPSVFWLAVSNLLSLVALVAIAVALGLLLRDRQDTISGLNAELAAQVEDPGTVAIGNDTSTDTPLNSQICLSRIQQANLDATIYSDPRSACPYANGESSRFTVPGTDLMFEKECGVDYSGSDLGSVPVGNFEDCISLCAQMNLYITSVNGPCVAVTWSLRGRQGDFNKKVFCWLKYSAAGRKRTGIGVESAKLVSGGRM